MFSSGIIDGIDWRFVPLGRIIFWMPYDDTGKHPICIRAEKFPRPEAGESQRDETSCSPHRKPRARWGECVRRRCMRSGRPYRPPLQTRLRFSRRGGLYGRPNRVPISAGDRWFHRRRGALYMRPCRTAGITGPASEIAGLPGRIYNPPLRCVRPAMVHPTRPPATGSRFLPGTMVQWSDFRPAPHMVRRLSGVLPWVSQ